ncbi:MAG: hypothetical protein JRI80_14685 [Deltaproteobacteria bacterium]|nr:hypothetical protein [Deltaproteobacteria bacterium]
MEKEGKTTLIFPPLGLGRRMLERVSFLFGPPGICLPWFMDLPDENRENAVPSTSFILRPPEELRPPGDFPKLLQEYRVWMKDHSDRSALSFLSAGERINDPEDTRWEIQKMVREGHRIDIVEQKKNEGLKWHLILHLAARLEREREEAEKALRKSRQQGSPLKEALGEGADVLDIMDDLSPSLLPPVIEHDLLEDVCEAWLGLFGALVQRESILVTFDEEIFKFLTTLFAEAVSRLNLIQNLPGVCFHIGDPISLAARESSVSREGSLQKRSMAALYELARELHRKGEKTPESAGLIHSLQKMFPGKNDPGSIRVEMLSLPDREEAHTSQGQGILHGLSGKTLVFLKADSENA